MGLTAAAATALAGGLTAAGGLGSSLAVGIGGKKKQKRAFEYNQQLQQQQFEANQALMKQQADYNYDLWQKENEYNTPAAQRARLESAGYNPALMYQQGTTGNSSAPAQGYQAQNVDYGAYAGTPQASTLGEVVGGALKSGIQDFLSTISFAQDVRAKELENQNREIQNSIAQDESMYSGLFYRMRAALSQNEYYNKGGDLTSLDAQSIRENLLKKLQNEVVIQDFMKDLYSSETGLSKAHTKMLLESLKMASESHGWSREQHQFWQSVEKPVGNWGIVGKYLDILGKSLSKSIGDLPGSITKFGAASKLLKSSSKLRRDINSIYGY